MHQLQETWWKFPFCYLRLVPDKSRPQQKQSFSSRLVQEQQKVFVEANIFSSKSLPQQDVFPGQCLPGETQESNEAQWCL